MPYDLYHPDIVTWSRRQADALRRHVAGGPMSDVDWENVIEETGAIGRIEITEVSSNIFKAFVQGLKAVRWPDHPSVHDWYADSLTCLSLAQIRYHPSMATGIDLRANYSNARETVLAMNYGGSGGALPTIMELTIDALMDENGCPRILLDAIGCIVAAPQQDP